MEVRHQHKQKRKKNHFLKQLGGGHIPQETTLQGRFDSLHAQVELVTGLPPECLAQIN